MPPPYLVVHNISDCPIITLSLSVTAAGRENKSENIFSEEGFYVQSKKIIWFIYSQENLAAIFENTALKKKKKTSLIELPIFFSVLLNRAAFLNVLWPHRMSPSKHSAVRGSAPFVPGGVASFTVIRWWKMKDTACRMRLAGTTGVVWQQRKCSIVKYHLYKWCAGSNCWQSSCRQMFWCVNHARES